MTERNIWFSVLAWCSLVVTVQACKSDKPACSPEHLAKIEAAYVAEAVEACAGETYDSCKALAAIREKYQAKRESWKLCSK